MIAPRRVPLALLLVHLSAVAVAARPGNDGPVPDNPPQLAAPLAASSPVVKKVLDAGQLSDNLLRPDVWKAWEKGFHRQEGVLVCDNGPETLARRGASQTIVLNQVRPLPIIASAWSRADGVSGARDEDYSLYLDLIYSDGTPTSSLSGTPAAPGGPCPTPTCSTAGPSAGASPSAS